MAFEIGVAANHVDLWDKLLAFLTTNADLVASGQNWTVGWQAPAGAANETDTVLVGPGMGGTDQIYVGLRRVDNPGTSHYTLWMNGMTGLLTGANSITEHVNVSERVAVYLDSAPMSYWFVANGRRFTAVIKIATIYESLYCGLYLPYADPLQYSYPLFIGGSVSRALADPVGTNWTSTDDQHSNFVYSNASGNMSQMAARAPSHLLNPASEWGATYRGTNELPVYGVHPIFIPEYWDSSTSTNFPLGGYSLFNNMRPAPGGGFLLTPYTLGRFTPSAEASSLLGVLEGVFQVSSELNAPENVITEGGVEHLVFPNVFRTGFRYLSALALE